MLDDGKKITRIEALESGDRALGLDEVLQAMGAYDPIDCCRDYRRIQETIANIDQLPGFYSRIFGELPLVLRNLMDRRPVNQRYYIGNQLFLEHCTHIEIITFIFNVLRAQPELKRDSFIKDFYRIVEMFPNYIPFARTLMTLWGLRAEEIYRIGDQVGVNFNSFHFVPPELEFRFNPYHPRYHDSYGFPSVRQAWVALRNENFRIASIMRNEGICNLNYGTKVEVPVWAPMIFGDSSKRGGMR